VLLWSQMHGDETTASRALADMFNYIATAPDDDARAALGERLTLLAVPMLNPDGADAHRRRGAFGIDINRDARMLATPEGRALKAVQERWRPDFGFNLHDQNPRSRVGGPTASRPWRCSHRRRTPTPRRRRHSCARGSSPRTSPASSPLVGEHLTRYDDSYNARAFGDGMQSWGVSTVLIETGSWRGDERSTTCARRTSSRWSPRWTPSRTARSRARTYPLHGLPQNGRGMNDLIIRGGTIVLPGMPPYRADIAIDAPPWADRHRRRSSTSADLMRRASSSTARRRLERMSRCIRAGGPPSRSAARPIRRASSSGPSTA
jgi:hypothetical protein